MNLSQVTIALGLLASCPPALAQSHLPFDLIDITADKNGPEFPGIDFQFFMVGFEYHEAGGVAIMDYDNDSLLDIYLPNTEFHASKLYRNLGGGQFVDVGPALGVDEPQKRRGAGMFIDVENDGDLDLLSIGYPGYTADQDLYTLFRNNGAPLYNFTDVTDSAGNFPMAPTAELTLLGDSTGSAVGDYDGDGYTDFLTAYMARLPGYLYDQMRLYRSAPNIPILPGQLDYSERQFVDATITANLDTWINGATWVPSFVDYNRDGMLDLHINVDFGFDVLRLNDGNGGFLPDSANSTGVNGTPPETRNEMGIAFGDIDNDGDLDQFQSNAYYGDRFYRNDSSFGVAGAGMQFTDFAPLVGAQLARYGWGVSFADLDNDRDLDLLRVAGLVSPATNWFHQNQYPQTLADGVTPLFTDRGAEIPQFSKIIGNPAGDEDVGKSLVSFDFDNDGDLDVLVTRPGISPYLDTGKHVRTVLYKNTLSNGANWIQIDLRNTGGARNTAGARVHLHSGGVTQMREVVVGSSFIAQTPDRQHFGLGTDTQVPWVAVRWPNGGLTVERNLPINGIFTLNRLAFDALGDVDFDGILTVDDRRLLQKIIANPAGAAASLGNTPYLILGDMNRDNVLDSLDQTLIDILIP